MSVDYSQLTKAQLIHALETMTEWVRARVKDEQERPSTSLVLMQIRDELRRQNDRGDAFNVELLSFFERLTEDPQPGPDGSPVGSGQPAAAPDGQEGVQHG